MVKKICLICIVLSIIFSLFIMQGNFAYAAEEEIVFKDFDESNVLDDLMSSETFNIEDYPYTEAAVMKHAGIVAFIEYCYSFRAEDQDNYALYLYFYNPQCLNIDTDNLGNKVQMGTSVDENSKPINFEKYNLIYCNMSTGDYYQLFYKFRIDINTQELLQTLNSNVRRYDISGVELVTDGQSTAIEYAVGGTYKFSGYAAGCGPDKTAESTLNCIIEEFEVAELDVHHTYFRTNTSNLGAGHRNQLNSVYFAVDNALHERYGRLQKILAEWYEYKTQPIIVTKNLDAYNYIKDYIGTHIDVGSLNYRLFYDEYVAYNYFSYGWSWNIESGNIGDINVVTHDNDDCLYYLFYDSQLGDVSGNEIHDYILDYDRSSENGYLPIKNGNISADLFLSAVDSGRTKGYNERLFDVDNPDDYYDLLSYDSNHDWWDKLWDFGFCAPPTDGDIINKPPIYPVKEADLVGTDVEVSERLLIDVSDVVEFKDYVRAEMRVGRTVYLFRFANTDYFYKDVTITKVRTGDIKNQAYFAQETVFFDFDIIELTFNKDSEYTVIPAVSNPIDIVADVEPPQEEEPWIGEEIKESIDNINDDIKNFLSDIFNREYGDSGLPWWKTLLIVIACVVGLIILFPIFPYLIKLFIFIVSLPFKLIRYIISAIKVRSRKSEYKKSKDKKRRQMK